MRGHGSMMGHGMMGRGMMRHGMMGHRGMMDPLGMRMIFALIDSDGDGTISLQEWQAAHEKIFRAMDPDKDGTVTFEEMMDFMRGTGRPQGR
jgi:EF hand